MLGQKAAPSPNRRGCFLPTAVALALMLATSALFLAGLANQNAATAVADADAAHRSAAQTLAQLRLATARELAAYAVGNLAVDPEISLLLALQAAKTTAPDKIVLPEAEDALHRAVLASPVFKMLYGHSKAIAFVAYNAEGSRVATQSLDGMVRVWDATNGKQLATLPIEPLMASTITFNQDGTQIAWVDADTKTFSDANAPTLVVKMWDARSGKLLRSVPLPVRVHDWGADALDPDWNRVAIGKADGTTIMYDIETGDELFTLSKHDDGVSGAAFSADGTLIATASLDGTAKVWDAQTGKLLLAFNSGASLRMVKFSPNGKQLAAAAIDGRVRIWDLVSGAELRQLDPQVGALVAVGWSRDGTLIAAGGAGNGAVVWDPASGKELYRLLGEKRINDLAFSPDGKQLLTAGQDATARITELTPSQELMTIPIADWGGRAVYSPDSTRLLFGLNDGSSRVVDAMTGEVLLTLDGHQGTVDGVAFSPDGSEIATGDQEGTVRVWENATGKLLLKLDGPTSPLAQGSVPHNIAYAVAFSPDGSRIGVATLEGARVWDTRTGRELFTPTLDANFIPGTVAEAWCIAFSPDGQMVAVSTDRGATQLFDATTGKEITTLQASSGPTSNVWGIAFSPTSPGSGASDMRLATGNDDGTTQVWDLSTLLKLGPASVKELFTMAGHEGIINGVAFSRDGKRIATVGGDGLLKLWDAGTGNELVSLAIGGGALYNVMYSPNGKYLVVGQRHGVYVLAQSLDELQVIAEARLARTWTLVECQKFLHMDQCPPTP